MYKKIKKYFAARCGKTHAKIYVCRAFFFGTRQRYTFVVRFTTPHGKDDE
jgi:hypothetical protein